MPDYIKNTAGYQETRGTSEGLDTWFPDWTHAELQSFHLEFYSEFAKRYDSDPRVAFLQVGFGLWGEYHIYDGPNTIGVHFPAKSFQKSFFAHLQGQFAKLCLTKAPAPTPTPSEVKALTDFTKPKRGDSEIAQREKKRIAAILRGEQVETKERSMELLGLHARWGA